MIADQAPTTHERLKSSERAAILRIVPLSLGQGESVLPIDVIENLFVGGAQPVADLVRGGDLAGLPGDPARGAGGEHGLVELNALIRDAGHAIPEGCARVGEAHDLDDGVGCRARSDQIDLQSTLDMRRHSRVADHLAEIRVAQAVSGIAALNRKE
jgi:hypothetical protein